MKPEGKQDHTSTYIRDYIPKAAPKSKPARPDYRPVATGRPFSGTTVHKQTYKTWEIPRVQSMKPESMRRSALSAFDHRSTFQHDYPGHYGNLARSKINPPEPALQRSIGPMEKDTTHRVDYTKKNAMPEKSAKPPEHIVHHADAFDHKTSHQHSYTWPDDFKPSESCKPNTQVFTSRQPFEDDTTHRLTYKSWELPSREAWQGNDEWKPSSIPFDHKTTFQHDYLAKTVPPAKSAKPDTVRLSPGSFNGNTTHNETYKQWQAAPRENYKPSGGYKPSSTKFNGQTTFQADFTKKHTERVEPCPPKEGGLRLVGPQEFTTNYTDDYAKKELHDCPAKYLSGEQGVTSSNGFQYALDRNGHQWFYKPNGVSEKVEIVAL